MLKDKSLSEEAISFLKEFEEELDNVSQKLINTFNKFKGVVLNEHCTQFECPYCGSEKVDAMDSNFENNTYYDFMECDECGKTWYEVYTFSHIEGSKLDED